MEIEQAQGVSQFDMSISTLGRINALLWFANEASQQDDAITWFKIVRNMWKEIDAYLTEDERLGMNKKYAEVHPKYLLFVTYYNNWVKNKNNPFTPPREVYDFLFDWELQIRRLMDKYKLLLRKSEDITKRMI